MMRKAALFAALLAPVLVQAAEHGGVQKQKAAIDQVVEQPAKGSSRAGIFDLLISKGIPFIDVGMGLNRKKGPVSGMVRSTYFSTENGQKVKDMAVAPLADNPENLYRTNIQIGELNALNAALAVIRFKQLRGFYFEEIPYYNVLYDLGDQKIVGESDE